jgi:hypothetical protein
MIKKLSLHFLEGNQVIEKFLEKKFFTHLERLFHLCPSKTIFQSPQFLHSWYQIKHPEFHPIMVLHYAENQLAAALCLAIKKDKRGNYSKSFARIIGAGEYDAEYQNWLVSRNLESIFLPQAFHLIFSHFPQSKIVLRFIPYKESLQWIAHDPYWEKFTVIQPFRRPLMQLNHPDFDALYKKRHLKAKFNRFNKAGKMELEEIKDLDRFLSIFEEIMVLVDFRQAALFNKIPSKNKALSKPLFIQLFQKGLLQVTVLTLNGVITSCIIGIKDGSWMHLAGLITFSPFYSKLSPGLVITYALGKMLENQGYQYFDLTPGDDGYKERLASNADEVYELTITKDPTYRLKRKIRKNFFKYLLSKGIRPMDFQLQVRKKIYLWKNKINQFPKYFFKNAEDITLENIPLTNMEKNNLQHLLCYENTFHTSRWEFLEDALSRIEAGESFLTSVVNGRLICCIWINDNKEITTPSVDPIEDMMKKEKSLETAANHVV